MIQLLVLILALVGLCAVVSFLMVFFGFQSSTLFSKKFKVLSYEICVDSTKGKDLTLKIEKK